MSQSSTAPTIARTVERIVERNAERVSKTIAEYQADADFKGSAAPSSDIAPDNQTARPIAYRTRGQGHGPIVRLMSPSDLGEILKPFVFLDLFAGDAAFMGRMPLHPHSGIATVTVITEGNVRFDDPKAGRGTIGYGGVEWMRAAGGVWHGKEMSPGTSSKIQGYQLWIALPPDLENGEVDSQYLEEAAMPSIGPARLILGSYENVHSPVRAPSGINYLLVTLKPGQRWTYQPPVGQSVLWLSLAQGQLLAPQPARAGDMLVYQHGESAISLTAVSEEPAVFVLGSAVPHPHPLALGSYSVHTNHHALQQGEAKIAEIKARMEQDASLAARAHGVPIYR